MGAGSTSVSNFNIGGTDGTAHATISVASGAASYVVEVPPAGAAVRRPTHNIATVETSTIVAPVDSPTHNGDRASRRAAGTDAAIRSFTTERPIREEREAATDVPDRSFYRSRRVSRATDAIDAFVQPTDRTDLTLRDSIEH